MTQKFRGNAPVTDEWMHLHSFHHEDLDWRLFFRVKDQSGGWISGKLVVDGKAPRKANYWLGWRDGRFARTRDAGTLYTGRQELYEQVENFINQGHTNGNPNA
jgi:hypothetical protein